MKKIVDNDTLTAAVEELYEKTRAAMLERTGQWRQLEITFAHVCRIAKMHRIAVEPLPIPKSTVQAAPQIVTLEAQAPKAKAAPAPPVAGDVLADNAPRPKRRRSTKKTS